MKICRVFSLDDPKLAGAMTAEQLCEMGRQFPHLIPCGGLNWNWTYRTTCQGCDGHPTQMSYSQRLMRRAMLSAHKKTAVRPHASKVDGGGES